MKKETLRASWQLRAVGSSEWFDTKVPGSVLETLLVNHKVKDPYVGTNEYEVRDEFRKDYEYRCAFHVEESYLQEQKVDMVFYCLDTIAAIKINGKAVGEAYNMHRVWRFSVKDLIHAGENIMEIYFRSPIEFVESYVPEPGREITMVNTGTMYGSQYIRKAHSMFGWDWGAQLPDIGILRPVELEAYSHGRILDAEILQKHEENKVTVTVNTTYEILQAAESFSDKENDAFLVEVTLVSPSGEKMNVIADKEEKAEFVVEDPKLWWPAGYGEQSLYEVLVTLKKDGSIIDKKSYHIGLRTITVSEEKDQWGTEFAFMINGIKIFAKGANYIPEDCVYPWITEERLDKLTDDALFANFNCLRIWGGGYYPSDAFYDLCDRKGLLIWQDCMFACNIYDLTPGFIENIEEEIRDNVTRLRHHASLALWAGNNEMETAWLNWNETKFHPMSLKRDYLVQFEYIIPKVLKECDKERFYMPSSPYSGGSFDDPDDENRGDCHYWQVWHGQKPFSDYLNHYFRFCSEFGFQSFPSMKTIRTFASGEDLNIFSEVMESHQKNPSANGKILYYLSENFRYPKNLDSLVYISQVMQGMAMKTGIDHWRRNRGRCMGSIYWQFNDDWPVASWSSVDYYGRYKALHYMAKRFYASLAGSIRKENTSMEAWAENETLQAAVCKVEMRLKKLDFTVLDEVITEVEVPALSAVKLTEKDYAELICGCEKEVFLECRFTFIQNGVETITTESEIFVPFKHLKLEVPELYAKITEGEKEYQICVSSNTYTPFLNIDFKNCDCVLSDNFFSITGPETLVVKAPKEKISIPSDFEGKFETDLVLESIRTTY